MIRRIISARRLKLAQVDIERLEQLAKELPLFAELMEADLFIDCPVSEERAVVLAQASPVSVSSMYQKSVVGEDALLCNEPAIFRALGCNAPVRDIKAVTQENRTVRQNVVPVHGKAGQVIAVLIQETDISQDIRQGKKLEALSKSYEEADPSLRTERVEDGNKLALREVHHRMKNSLQLVASILNMQARKFRGTQTEKILSENVARVLTIATVHDMLTDKEGSSEMVNVLSLLRQLTAALERFAPEDKNIIFSVSGDDAFIGSHQASAVALVVNELITNALEHAFADRDNGQISVTFVSGSFFHVVTVYDDGVGFKSEQMMEERLGLRIVDSTVRGKLQGRLHIHSDEGGTRVSFDIKNDIM